MSTSVCLGEFRNPSMQFRSVPFWSLNDWLDGPEIRRQLQEFKKGGYGGAYLHSRIGLLTPYLGADWWKAMDAGVKACEELGLEAWFYDEDKWPSGFAGGIVPLQSPDFHARCLLRLTADSNLPVDSELLTQDAQYKYVVHKSPLGHPWFNGTCWVDLMNPAAVQAFIDCSYKPYAERYAGQIGGTVKGIFTDEPQVSPRVDNVEFERRGIVTAGELSYSPTLRPRFLREHGYDFVEHVAGLFEEVGQWRKLRYDYFRTLAAQFEDAFSRPIGEYCAKAGMVWTGHFNSEETPASVKKNVGNMMAQYRHMQRPGIDWLFLTIRNGLNTAKSLSSVANQYGLPRRLSEMFGVSGQNMSFEDRKWIADWHAVLGINHVCPHLALYSLKGVRKRDYPPTLSPQQPYWEHNPIVEDHMARVSYATTVGQYAPQVLVLHPLESAYLDDLNVWRSPQHAVFMEVMAHLLANHCDFDLGDEQILSEIGALDGDRLRVGAMRYAAVVLPPMATIRPSTLRLLEGLAAVGGPIVAVDALPTLVDAEENEAALEGLRRLARVVGVASLAEELQKTLPFAVRLVGARSEFVYTQRRVTPNGQLVLLSNTQRLDGADLVLHLADAEDNPVLWEPSTGHALALVRQSDGGVRLRLPPAGTVFVTTGDASSAAELDGPYRIAEFERPVLTLDGPWSGRRRDPNALTLDFARYSLDGGATFSDPEPVLGIHARMTETRYNGPLQLVFEAEVDVVPAETHLVCEQPEMYAFIHVNEQPVDLAGDAFYRDRSFHRVDISRQIVQGANRVTMALKYVAPVPDSSDAVARYGSEIESIYLIGEFGVQATLSAHPPAPSQRNLEGLLPSRPVHRYSGFRVVGESSRFEGDLAPQGYPFYAGAFELSRDFEIPTVESSQRYYLVFPAVEAIVVVAELNGVALPPLAWSPMEIEITAALRCGRNELRLRLVNSLRNLLGPHHHRDGELVRVGPDSFGGRSTWVGGGPGESDWYDVRKTGETRIWRDDWHGIGFGLLEPARIVARR